MNREVDQLTRAIAVRADLAGQRARLVSGGDRSPEVVRDLIGCLGTALDQALALGATLETTTRIRRLR